MTWLSELVVRPTLNTVGIPLSSYQATVWWKKFKIILIEDLNLWRGSINQVQYSCVSQWHTVQQLHTSSIICVHKFNSSSKIFQSSITINSSLKIFLNFSMSSSNQLSLEKFQKHFQSSSQVRPEWKNFKV